MIDVDFTNMTPDIAVAELYPTAKPLASMREVLLYFSEYATTQELVEFRGIIGTIPATTFRCPK